MRNPRPQRQQILGARSRLWLAAASYLAIWYWAYAVCWPDYSYQGLPSPAAGTPLSVCGAVFCALMPVAVLPQDLRRPSSLALWFLYLAIFAPTALISAFVPGPALGGFNGFVITLTAAMLLLAVAQRIPLRPLKHSHVQPADMAMLAAGAAASVLCALLVTTGLRYSFVGLLDVYSARAAFDQAARAVPLLQYAVDWAAYVFAPLALAIGLETRNGTVIAAGIATELLLYFTTANKSFFFSPLVVVGVWAILRRKVPSKSPLRRLIWAATALFAGCAAARELAGLRLPNTFAFDRIAVVPAELNLYYYRFFSHNPFVLWADSFLRGITTSPYSLRIPYVVGAHFFHSTSADANASLWATGYANAGTWGILLETLLLAGTLWLLDSTCSNLKNPRLAAASISMCILYLCNSPVETTLRSAGLILMPVLFLLIRDPQPTPAHSAERNRQKRLAPTPSRRLVKTL